MWNIKAHWVLKKINSCIIFYICRFDSLHTSQAILKIYSVIYFKLIWQNVMET